MAYPLKPSAFKALLHERGIRARKSLGQNFLVDPNYLDAIVRAMEIDSSTEVIEIGTGAGHLTERLASTAARVWSFEVDERMHALASEQLGKRPNLELIFGDGARFESKVRPTAGRKLVMVSNLPYATYLSLLLKMTSTKLPVAAWFVMVQADVVDRMSAPPGSRRYGPLAVVIQGLFEMRRVAKAGRALFHPPPRVESTVIGLTRKVPARDLDRVYVRLTKLFAQRRKKLRAALEAMGERDSKAWEFADRRVEELDPTTLLSL